MEQSEQEGAVFILVYMDIDTIEHSVPGSQQRPNDGDWWEMERHVGESNILRETEA